MVTIKDNRKKSCRFEKLSVGECFMYESGLYMVTEDAVLKQDVCDDFDDVDAINALNLRNGCLYHINHINEKTIVEPVDIEITII